MQGDFGEVEIAVARDRNRSFEPKILPKHERRFAGFDDKILSLYARGMTTRDMQSHWEEIYGVEVSLSLISEVTEAVMEEVRTWQSRPLDPVYPIVYLDALLVKHHGSEAAIDPGVLAHRTVQKLHLAAALLNFFQQEHLVHEHYKPIGPEQSRG